MVDSVSIVDVDKFNELGLLVNSKFDKLFDLSTLISNSNDYVFGYYEEDVLYGFIHVSKMYEVLDVVNIVVSLEKRNCGIGSMLLSYALEYFDDVDKVLLEVNENNVNAIKLYEKYDFKVINVRKNYYGSDSALIMERDV